MAVLTGEQRSDIYQLLDYIELSRDEVEQLVGDYADLQRILNEAQQLQETTNKLILRLEEIVS